MLRLQHDYLGKEKERLVQVRIWKEHAGLRRLALRKSIGKEKDVTIADVVRQLINS